MKTPTKLANTMIITTAIVGSSSNSSSSSFFLLYSSGVIIWAVNCCIYKDNLFRLIWLPIVVSFPGRNNRNPFIVGISSVISSCTFLWPYPRLSSPPIWSLITAIPSKKLWREPKQPEKGLVAGMVGLYWSPGGEDLLSIGKGKWLSSIRLLEDNRYI